MGRAFEYRKATKLKRWGHMAKTFTRLGKQIAIAVKAGGPEPENNPALRSVIAVCKRENMPKDNIERAIKNAMGKDQSDYKGVTYEGYGPHGVAVFVDTLTDNTTRTVADVRSVFNKFSGNMGTTGSLSFLFDHKCVFTFKKKADMDMDDFILEMIDYGVDEEFDEDEEEGTITIYGEPTSYNAIQKQLRSLMRMSPLSLRNWGSATMRASYSMTVFPVILFLFQRVRPLGAMMVVTPSLVVTVDAASSASVHHSPLALARMLTVNSK